RHKADYIEACKGEAAATAAVDAAQKALGAVAAAQGLVNHAKGKWIGGAEKGIAAAQEKLRQAKTAAERAAATKELADWEENLNAGRQALKERQAALEAAEREQPKLVASLERAKRSLVEAKSRTVRAVDELGLLPLLGSDALDTRLAKFVVLFEATPRGLAEFAARGKTEQRLVDELLADDPLMQQMVEADGANGGRYGDAMAIYAGIRARSPNAAQGPLQRLAVAIALEHAVPIAQRNAVAATDAPAHVDPIGRYLHYEQALSAGELDPCFGNLSAWDLRMVVNGEEPTETLAWGREMLRNYRPDHVYTSDYRWRYVGAVRTEIRYGSQENKYDKDELQFFQNILMNGGVCGRRAFFGRFLLRAFGVPTTARPQRGHAALVHWTPDGWVPCLGAGWGSGWTKTRYGKDLDFLATTQARGLGDAYLQIKRAQWIGDVAGEKRVFGALAGDPGFWYGVALHRQRALIEAAQTKTLAAVGSELAEANESSVHYAVEAATVTDADRAIVSRDDGVLVIPAVACSSPAKSTRKIVFMPSNLGGKQLHYARNGGDQDFEYSFDAPTAGRYALTARVVTPSWKQHLLVSANGGAPVDLALPFTVGMWQTTEPVHVTLVAGRNVLRFTRVGAPREVEVKGFTIRDFTLKPAR
ncbi:MAG: hypothetical protein H6835_20975, partial [Planctomycetes bacterium]|nr:hypothetical protein [Planctomycetota bacterium]